MSGGGPSPFELLGTPPTLDLAAVKRAWFAALARHPPHADPEGFRRIRAAYEALTAPGGLALAYLATPVDLDAELAAYRARYDQPLAAAAAATAQAEAGEGAATRFMEDLYRRSLDEALAMFR